MDMYVIKEVQSNVNDRSRRWFSVPTIKFFQLYCILENFDNKMWENVAFTASSAWS